MSEQAKRQMSDEGELLKGIAKVYQIQCGACWSTQQVDAANEACAAGMFYERGWRPVPMTERYMVIRCPKCIR